MRFLRWRARTDLEFLCQHVLDYPNVERAVHGPILDILQKFPTPTKMESLHHDTYNRLSGRWEYSPLIPISNLTGKRRRLILDSRGFLKTTINVQAHTVQWLINYPEIAVAIFQSNADKVEMILKAIKRIFQYNKVFRSLFPEYCPQTRIDDWGKVGEFTVEARPKQSPKREPSVIALALEKGTAGMHFEVMKFSDVVEPENIKRTEAITSSFYMAENLLIAPGYWIDVEGTRYVFNDLYGDIIKKYLAEKARKQPPSYAIMVKGCYRRLGPKGEAPQHIPEELEWPYLREEGKKVSWWQEDNQGNARFTVDHLESLEKNDPYIFSAQQLNNPIGGVGGVAVFEVDPAAGKPKSISREDYNLRVKGRIVYRDISIDTAYTTGPRSNHTAIVVGAWDSFNRCYVEEIIHGKFSAEDLIKQILLAGVKYRPNSMKMEKVPFNEGLMPALRREMELNGIYLPIELLKRDNAASKIDRISTTLPPYYSLGNIIFLKDLVPGDKEGSDRVWSHLLQELRQFPIGESDDILDAVADLFQNKEVMGRLTNQKTVKEEEDIQKDRFLRMVGVADDGEDFSVSGISPHHYKTGGL